MQKVFRITVDISKKIPAPAFEVNTNDLKSVKLEITITNGLSLLDLTDVTPRINIRKPDNEVIFQDCEIVDATDGKVQIVLENQAYLVPGTHTAEIACYKGNEITAITGTFSYKSIKGIMNNEAVESKSEFTAIDRKLVDVQEILKDVRENGTGIDAQARADIQKNTALLADTAKKSEVTALQTELTNKATKQDIQQLSLSFKESYPTKAALESAYQNGDNANHVVLADNMIYTYKNGWVSTGIQANGTGVSPKTVSVDKLTDELQKLMKMGNIAWKLGQYQADGTTTTINRVARTDGKIPLEIGDKIEITDSDYTFKLYFFDNNGKFVKTTPNWLTGVYTMTEKFSVGINARSLSNTGDFIVEEVGNKVTILKPSYPFDKLEEKVNLKADEKVAVLKRELSDYKPVNSKFGNWEKAYIPTNLVPAYSDKCLLSSVVKVNEGESIGIINSSGHDYKIAYCDQNGTISRVSPSYLTTDTKFTEPGYIRMQLHRIDLKDITLGESQFAGFYTYVVSKNTDWKPVNPTYIKDPYINSNAYIPPVSKAGNLNNIYSLWDGLMNKYPSLITKSTMATDTSGLPIYRYDIKPRQPQPMEPSLGDVVLPKIIYIGGLHGNEGTSLYVDFRFFSDMLDNWSKNNALKPLRFNTHFIVIPACTPWAVDNFSRTNVNGININRNFPTGWSLRAEGVDYGGTEPSSEIETRNMISLLENNKDALLVIDSHNTSSVGSSNKLGYVSITEGHRELNAVMNSCIRVADGITRMKYPLLEIEKGYFRGSNLFALGQANIGGSMMNHYKTLGINGVISEKADYFDYTNSYNQEHLQDIGVDFIGNLIQSALLNESLLRNRTN